MLRPERAFPRTRRLTSVTLVGAVVLFTVAIMLGLLLYYAQFSGTVRWLLGVAFLAVLAALAWDQVGRRTAQPSPLVGSAAPAITREGPLASFAAAVRRASTGLPYSQVLVASRARAAFLEHVRLALGLSAEAMRDVQRNPATLQRLLGDDVLAEFVHLQVADLDERSRWVRRARARGGFTPELQGVLQRMEAWR